jgi:hypothetical protein
MKEALAKASKIGPAGDLAQTVAMAFVAAMLDIGKMEPGTMLANITGVQELFDMTHGTDSPPMRDPNKPETWQDIMTETPSNVHPFPAPAVPVTTYSSYPGRP